MRTNGPEVPLVFGPCWAQSLLNERGVAARMEVGTFLWDMTDFYEHFNRDILMTKGEGTSFPTPARHNLDQHPWLQKGAEHAWADKKMPISPAMG